MIGNEEWRDFVRSNYTQMGVEQMAYILGVTRSEILQEFPMLKGRRIQRPLQTILIIKPRSEAPGD